MNIRTLSIIICTALTVLPAQAQLSSVRRVFVIVMENHNWSQFKGASNAPYINNTLLPQASHAEQYYNPPGLHPSLPNYLWMEAGTNFGITNDNNPSINHQSTTAHLVTQLKNAGITWKSYQEDISGASCPLTSFNNYAPKHNPFIYFDDVTNTNDVNSAYCIAHVRPFPELATDLQNNTVAQYVFITPNLCDDGHDSCAPLSDPIRQTDNWLAANVPMILNSAAYQDGGAIFITWDEGSGGSDGPIGMIVLSRLAKGGGYSNTIHYTHGSMLRTVEEIFGVSLLGAAAAQTDLRDLFAAPAVPALLSALTCSPTTLASAAASTCTVSLSAATTANVSVALSSSNTGLSVPASVTIGAGQSAAQFLAVAGAISATGTAVVTASYGGVSKLVSFTITAGSSTPAVYLSDLTWTYVTNGWGPVEKDRSNGEAAAGDGNPLTLNGQVYSKGLGVHANSETRYALASGCSVFYAEIGVDDEVGSAGSVTFQVWADGVKLYDSGILYGFSATQIVNVNISGRSQLSLIVTDGGNGNGSDHADWAAAQLNCSGPLTGIRYLSDSNFTVAANGWGPVERDESNGEMAAGDGLPLTLNGKTYAKGLGVHANSDVRLSLGGACTAFTSDIGVDDEVGPRGSVIFQVWADGVKLYDSGVMYGDSFTQTLNVNVAGKNNLQLLVLDSGDGIGSDHGDWANAQLSCGAISGTRYVSDLPYTVIANGWGPVERDMSNGETAAGDGRAITLNGKTYAKGLGVHANSDVRVNLGGACSAFASDVGVDDEVDPRGSIVFQVWADGAKLFDSGVMYNASQTQTVNVNIAGKSELKLLVLDAGDGNGSDHGDWAYARLTCN